MGQSSQLILLPWLEGFTLTLVKSEKKSKEFFAIFSIFYIFLESITSGIIPGVEITLELEYSSDDFRILSAEDDYEHEDDIVIQIVEARLVIPMGN